MAGIGAGLQLGGMATGMADMGQAANQAPAFWAQTQGLQLQNQAEQQKIAMGQRQAREMEGLKRAFDEGGGDQAKTLQLVGQYAPSHLPQMMGAYGGLGLKQAQANMANAHGGLFDANAGFVNEKARGQQITNAASSEELVRKVAEGAQQFVKPDGTIDEAAAKAYIAQHGEEFKKWGIDPTMVSNIPLTKENLNAYATGGLGGHDYVELQKLKNIPPGLVEKFANDIGATTPSGKADVGNPNVKAYIKKLTDISHGGEGVPSAGPGMAVGEDAIVKLPQGQQGVVRAIIEGRQSPPSGFAQKTPYWQNIMQYVYAADPLWNENRAQMRRDFTTGPDGRNIRALNTATVHLGAYLEAAEGLANGTFQPGNAMYNRISMILGHSAPTTFEAIKNAVAGEQASALKGTATDKEIEHMLKTMNDANSPEQFVNAGKGSLGVMGQKLNTYGESYRQYNPNDTFWSPVLPTASSIFKKYSVSGAPEPASERPVPGRPNASPAPATKETEEGKRLHALLFPESK